MNIINILLLHMLLIVVCAGGFAGFFKAKEERGEYTKQWVHMLLLVITFVAPQIPIALFFVQHDWNVEQSYCIQTVQV